MTHRTVINAGRTSWKSLLNPWRSRQVWILDLECGHTEYRDVARFPTPPQRVECHTCHMVTLPAILEVE